MGKKKFIDKKTAKTFLLVNRSRSDNLYYEEGSTPNVLIPKGMEGSVSSLIGSQIRPRHYEDDEVYDEYDEYDEYDDFDEYDEYDEEEESYMHREEGRIYGETTDKDGLPLDGTDYQAHMKEAGPGIFIAAGGDIQMIEESNVKIDDDLLPAELRSVQLPKAVNLKYDEVDPELLAAMEEIENEEWDDDKNEEGYIDDNFVQLAIEDKSDDGFDFDEHIRNLLKAREEKEKSRVELTEDRYAEEIRIDPEKEDRKERDIDHQYNAIINQYSDNDDDDDVHGHIELTDELFQDALDEFLEDEAKEKKRDYSEWNLNKDDDHPHLTLKEIIEENDKKQEKEEEVIEDVNEEEEDEEIGELIERQFARPEKDDMDCESICSTYSNLLNHPTVIGAPKKIKKISISKKTGMPIVEKDSEEEEDEGEGVNEEDMVAVENSGEKRNKKETAEEKRLRKQKVKEMKSMKRQQKKQLKEAFKEEKKKAERIRAASNTVSSFKVN